ncbi:glucose dehydrogenase [FAD, quinone]-like isoform X1 [Rhopalosiphum maidis]|uniref:glucose dehydrogenase [FAD, quinone]-like isoform X1 n=2 Tax=Rhopalosiphum maidis TaxID=43146 RepID=UPI000EFFC511|nr:glucose dehydrogenase [FAD, quinone]-like isoform X1 [Rhopalosiphum maidis]
MRVVVYLHIFAQVLNVLATSKHIKHKVVNVFASTGSNNKGNAEKCIQNAEHIETSFVKELCKSNPDLEEFMIAADILIRSDCVLIDSCRRVIEQPHDDVDEVDFIVVGGGVAGPVVAGRLSENPKWTVTLLESGPEQPAATDIPALLSSAIATKYDWQYTTAPQKNACLAYGGVCGWPRGKVLGGTAVLSGSMYSRGHRDVYDGWLRDGNVGWGYDDVLPFFKMSENNKDYQTEHHGTRGPISVQKPSEILPITRTLMEAARELGYEEIDMSHPEPMGFSIAQLMITSSKTRMTTPTAYLRPHLRIRGNLRVKTNSHVTRLLVAADRRSVYGVEYVDSANRTRRLTARKEVILCAGVIGSAHLLMVSGIGPAEDLRPLGVPVVQDLRVGHNLQHHVASKLSFQLNVTNDRLLTFETIGQYLKQRSGPLSTTGGLQTSAFLRSDRAGPADPADVQLFFDGYSPNCAYAQPVYGGCMAAADPVLMNVRPVNVRPLSRGTIRLTSADPFVRPRIDPNYLAAEADVDVLVWGLRLANDLVRTGALQRLGATVDRKPAEHCGRHAFGTDSYWRCLIRYHTRGENHHAGTCKMGPAADPTAVVDPELRVHRVRGVRVADSSVFPTQPNCNPIAPVVMVAERAAQFIKNTWR